ncbi:MAG: 30S ribosomal protein S11 [Candidatus Curtissbacteria bacterium]|nr:30S ribosomal protein S11 [bacterium]MDZ4209835.1 30S ribosomal protein S11 [Candidatus Curtissbacteria bacterium]
MAKKQNQTLISAKIHVSATFNNTLVTATDMAGNTIAWETTGSTGFKGTRKSTPFAATTTVEKLLKKILERGVKEVEVYIKGPGPGRDASLRAIRAAGLKMNLIADVTPIPHNGVRAKKKRRV